MRTTLTVATAEDIGNAEDSPGDAYLETECELS